MSRLPASAVTPAAPAATARPLRRDAADNLERLLAAAVTVFARDGVDACVEQVAREAGIGLGTVYRRFPNKQALIDELVTRHFDDLIAAAEVALDAPAGDGLERYLRAVGALMLQRHGFLPMIWTGKRRASQVVILRPIVEELLARAQRHGVVGPDVRPGDITAILWSLGGVIQMSNAVAPDLWARHLDFALAGLRADRLAFSAPPITSRQIDRIVE